MNEVKSKQVWRLIQALKIEQQCTTYLYDLSLKLTKNNIDAFSMEDLWKAMAAGMLLNKLEKPVTFDANLVAKGFLFAYILGKDIVEEKGVENDIVQSGSEVV